jgi:hypothetical protein
MKASAQGAGRMGGAKRTAYLSEKDKEGCVPGFASCRPGPAAKLFSKGLKKLLNVFLKTSRCF